jgi:predicted hydrolase (HD superfamily)
MLENTILIIVLTALVLYIFYMMRSVSYKEETPDQENVEQELPPVDSVAPVVEQKAAAVKPAKKAVKKAVKKAKKKPRNRREF